LPAEPGIDAHEQDNIDLIHHILTVVEAGGWSEHQSGLAAQRPDELQGSVHVIGSLWVERDVRSPGLSEVLNHAVNWLYHQMYVNILRYSVVAQSLAYHWADREVGNVVVVYQPKEASLNQYRSRSNIHCNL